MADVYADIREHRRLFMQQRAGALVEISGFIKGLFFVAMDDAAAELALLYGTGLVDGETQRQALAAAIDENLPYFEAAFNRQQAEQD